MKNMKVLKLVLNLMVLSLLLPVTTSFAASWQIPIGTVDISLLAASPVLGPDGTIYISSGEAYTSSALSGGYGNLYSVSPAGAVNWTYALQGYEGFPSVAVDGSGNIYVVSGTDDAASVFSIDSLGTAHWS